ncbi:MAG TPA: alpha/beta hydrolase [Phototrophicaceae bacterium]|nr:alpha/beta hydrolase [Phototrophicaceae bacterium]
MLRFARALLIVSLLIGISVSAAGAQGNFVPKFVNVAYAGDSIPGDVLDVYWPSNGAPPFPTVVMFTTSSGKKSDLYDEGVPQFINSLGYAAVTVSYRPALPESYEDAFCALAWAYQNNDQYGLDIQETALYGVSWGGLVAAFVGETTDNAAPYLTNCPYSLPTGFFPRGVMTNSGAFLTIPDEIASFAQNGLLPDIAALPSAALDKALDTMRKTPPDQWCCLYFPNDVHDALYELPIFHVNDHEPPFLLIQGVADTTIPYQDTLNYAQALLDHSSDVQLDFKGTSGHIIDLFPLQDTISAFLDYAFR